MTNKEAIDILWQYDVNFEPHPAEDIMHAIDMAIEALKSQDRQAIIAGSYLLEDTCVAQKRRYTFGNDGFSLESAYHDCKLVFDEITDDDSFQEADTGLILYYANEIIYALHEAMSCSEIPNSSDCISRQDAIDAAECIIDHHSITPYETMRSAIDHLKRIIDGMPSAQPDNKHDCEDCTKCKHFPRFARETPCVSCSNNYVNKWEKGIGE